MSILHLEHVGYTYEKSETPVLRDITADFECGKMYAIIGKSGAGKTTLLSLISGLDICGQGAIYYNGEDLKNRNRDGYRAVNIGVVFQSYNLLLNASAVENVILSMQLSRHFSENGDGRKHKNSNMQENSMGKAGNTKQEAYKLLERVGIDRETADRKVLKMSGGEQQRTGIARALSHNPDILIADEPTGNLDEETEDAIMEILEGLVRNENRCVIIVTHSHKVASHADEVLGLSGGRLVTVSQSK